MNRPLVSALVLACAAAAHCGPCEDALSILVRALDSQRSVKCSMVQVRRDGSDSITVSVQIQPRIGVAASVIRPITYSGMTSFDDGTKWKNYDPQRDVLRIEPSPMKFQMDIGTRTKLIKKNYKVELGGDDKVAGRTVAVVKLTPVASDAARRTLYIDRENSVILKYVVTEPQDEPLVTVDTVSVDFTSAIDLSKYVKLGSGAEKIEESWGPVEVARESDARSYVGFVPVVPTTLPSGLSKQAIHIVGTKERKFVGVRLTDGMAVVTVYIWKAIEGESEKDAPFGGKFDTAAGSLRIKVFGDATNKVKSNLADLFADRNQGPSLGSGTPVRPKNVLDKQDTGGGTGQMKPKLVIDNDEINE